MKLAKDLFLMGEAIHGGEIEKKILEKIKEIYPSAKEIPIRTKFWKIKYTEVTVNGKTVNSSLMPYTSGDVKGKIGKNIVAIKMPSHPFDIAKIYSMYKDKDAIIFYEDGKLRRIGVDGKVPSVFLDREPKGEVEIRSDGKLIDSNSYNLEVELLPGDDYITVGAHVDHWLTGFHDNLFAVDILTSLKPKVKKHGLKLLFFSSEEGPKCCTGSIQQPKDGTFIMISLDSLYPDRVVFSATPELWKFSSLFPIKRIEMPTPFSDHFSYITDGYPAMVLYNDDMIPVYHSNRDVEIREDYEFFCVIKNRLEKLIETLDNMSRENLDEDFKRITGKERKGSIVPMGLTSEVKRD
ncbi:peptidase M28 [Candidatus Acidianus copahuensis]|uniref:Peptidase M28 n=1 Tax=Candidatus Acidianus copahuensis TaxID=1160895 RepID=A0A031LR74_9CREN|nr:Zn-dependent exopeptidase M28 [Candidatus Acidianus copahuensis]EZQ10882.1 peptidase M28 [Candidatus Acidianus copahuensis]